MIALIQRNIKAYTRDRIAFFMSFLSVLILLVLYQLFLATSQVEGVRASMQVDQLPERAIEMVNLWLVAGLTSIVCMSGTLGVYSVMIKDKEIQIDEDFRVSGCPHWKIELSYMIAAIVAGWSSAIVCCLTGIVLFTGGVHVLMGFSLLRLLQIIGVIGLGCVVSAMLVAPLLIGIRSGAAFSTLSTIVGTLIGFLSGVYISLGAVDTPLRTVMTWFPLTQINALLKSLLMEQSIESVFARAPLETMLEYKAYYGITLNTQSGTLIQEQSMLLYIIICIICLLVLYLMLKKSRSTWQVSSR